MRGCEEREVVLSNIGLIHEKKNMIDEAIRYYNESLSHKKFYKSEYRLANCLIAKGNLADAEKIVQKMEDKGK